jgi:hypothetical protein
MDKEITMEEEVKVAKSPQELFDEKLAAEEARRKAQKNFDPKLHGVGTQPVTTPDSVVSLHKLHVALEARVAAIEDRVMRKR